MVRGRRSPSKSKPTSKSVGRRARATTVGGVKTAPRPPGPKQEAAQAYSVQRAERLLDRTPQHTEVVSAQVNPYALFQALFGYYGAQATHSDSPYDLRALFKLSAFSANAIMNIEACGLDFMPDFVVAIASSLRPRRLGSQMIVPNFGDLNRALTVYNGGADYTGFTNQQLGIPESYNVTGPNNGFPLTYASTGLFPTAVDMKVLLASYCPLATMIPVGRQIIRENDFSGFAFDTGAPIEGPAVNQDGGAFWQAGTIQGAKVIGVWLPESSNVACEGPMYTKWLLSLRLCTPVKFVAGFESPYHWLRRPGNHALCSHRVVGVPAVVGHLHALTRGRVPANIQIKLCPAVSPVTDLVRRLEQVINSLPSANKTAITAAFAPVEITILCYGMWLTSIARYGWYSLGVGWTTSGNNVLGLGIPGMRAYSKLWETLQVPKTFATLLGVTQPWNDKDGFLLPGFVSYGMPTTYPGTAGFFTGSSPLTIPGDQLSSQYYRNSIAIIRKYRPFEAVLAQATQMVPLARLGGSMLDVSITRDSVTSASANAVAIYARRELTNARVTNALFAISYLSYDLQRPLSNVEGNSFRSKLYRQPFMEGMSGNEAVADLAAISIYSGLVPQGTESGQNPSFSSEIPGPAVPTSPPPGWWEHMLAAAVPRYGNYGGPGFTAGKDVLSEGNPPMRRVGDHYEYELAPVDAEDALYKRHDEDYHNVHAVGMGSTEDADNRLFEGLLELSRRGELSSYGRAAREYFRPPGRLW